MDTQEVGVKGQLYSTGSSAWCSVLTWRGEVGQVGREVQGGGDICIHKADSLCCTAETNTTLSSNYTPIFFFLRVFSHQEADLGKSDGIQIIPSVFQDARVSPGQSLSVSYGIIF